MNAAEEDKKGSSVHTQYYLPLSSWSQIRQFIRHVFNILVKLPCHLSTRHWRTTPFHQFVSALLTSMRSNHLRDVRIDLWRQDCLVDVILRPRLNQLLDCRLHLLHSECGPQDSTIVALACQPPFEHRVNHRNDVRRSAVSLAQARQLLPKTEAQNHRRYAALPRNPCTQRAQKQCKFKLITTSVCWIWICIEATILL